MFKISKLLKFRRKKTKLPKEKLQEFETRLVTERGRLLEEIKKRNRPEDFGSDIDHGDEEADEAEEFVNVLAVSRTMRDQMSDIDAALARIKSETYGICDQCGSEISEPTLLIAPESRLCISCKKAR